MVVSNHKIFAVRLAINLQVTSEETIHKPNGMGKLALQSPHKNIFYEKKIRKREGGKEPKKGKNANANFCPLPRVINSLINIVCGSQ